MQSLVIIYHYRLVKACTMQSAPFSFLPLSKGRESVPPGSMPLDLRNVWNTNLEEQMDHIMEAIEKYPYIAMV